MSAGYEVLFVSQFTLYAQTHKGNRPDFSKAKGPGEAKPMYEAFLARARADYTEERVKDGQFGAHMLVDIANDGPVTIVLDTGEVIGGGGGDSGGGGGGGGAAASGGVEAITEEDVAVWHNLPAVPKHNNKKGRPSPEHLAAAKAAKEGRRAFLEGLLARVGEGGSPKLSLKSAEAALNSRKPKAGQTDAPAATAVGGSGRAQGQGESVPTSGRASLTSPVSSALELDSARVVLPMPQL